MVAPFLVPAYAAAAVGLWLVARPYGNPRWKLAATGGVLSNVAPTMLMLLGVRQPPEMSGQPLVRLHD